MTKTALRTTRTSSSPRGAIWLLIVALALVVGGGWLAHSVQTDGGRVEVRDVRFAASNGFLYSAKLYVPENATAETPAPGVVAIHGYINSRETQSPYAIEYARRGYVVLALDQSGHGYSDPPAFANGFGGPPALTYLQTLDIVDPDQIVLEGHSMGGWAVLIAAGVQPDGYASVVVSGSSTGTFGAPEGTPTFPRNFGLVFSQYDEFSQLMWGVPTADQINGTEKLQSLFGTEEPVEPRELYGSVEDGTARMLYQPAVTHPGDHITTAGVGPTIDWIQRTTTAPNPLPPSDQVWMWKEIGTLLGLLGGLLLIFAMGSLLVRARFFSGIHQAPADAKGQSGVMWWVSAAVLAAVPIVTYFYLQNNASQVFPTSALWPQNLTTGIMGWALGNGVIALVLFLLWWIVGGKRNGAGAASLGLVGHGSGFFGGIGRSLLLAIGVTGTLGAVLVASTWIFGTDFRFWVVALKPMSGLHLRIFLSYVIPFTAFFVVLGMVLHGQLRFSGGSRRGTSMLRNAIVLGIGFVGLLLFQYVPLLSGQPLPLGEPLLTIVAFQFLVLMPLVGLISTYFFHKTGRIWAGAFVSGIFVTWYIVASQATHFAF